MNFNNWGGIVSSRAFVTSKSDFGSHRCPGRLLKLLNYHRAMHVILVTARSFYHCRKPADPPLMAADLSHRLLEPFYHSQTLLVLRRGAGPHFVLCEARDLYASTSRVDQCIHR